jgi:hypothetical protein
MTDDLLLSFDIWLSSKWSGTGGGGASLCKKDAALLLIEDNRFGTDGTISSNIILGSICCVFPDKLLPW